MKHEEQQQQQQQKVVKGSTTCLQSDSGGACGVVSLPIGMPPGGAAGSALCCVAEPLNRDEWSHLTALYAPAATSHAPPPFLFHLQLWLTACHIFHRTRITTLSASFPSTPFLPLSAEGMLISSGCCGCFPLPLLFGFLCVSVVQ